MRFSKRPHLANGIAIAAAAAVVLGSGSQQLKQTFAPHELNAGDAPPPIIRETPVLHKGSIDFESAEERHLRVVLITKGLEQPWSIAFLPGGTMLVTERSGRLRIVRNGRLAP